MYALAKELQLLYSEKFKNIFLGLGGFHYEKIVFACVGKYLQISGIDAVLSETECFGIDVVQSVLEGSNYVRSKEGLSLINEAILSLMLEEYLKHFPISTNMKQDALDIVKSLQIGEGMESAASQAWKLKKSSLDKFVKDFKYFKSTMPVKATISNIGNFIQMSFILFVQI